MTHPFDSHQSQQRSASQLESCSVSKLLVCVLALNCFSNATASGASAARMIAYGVGPDLPSPRQSDWLLAATVAACYCCLRNALCRFVSKVFVLEADRASIGSSEARSRLGCLNLKVTSPAAAPCWRPGVPPASSKSRSTDPQLLQLSKNSHVGEQGSCCGHGVPYKQAQTCNRVQQYHFMLNNHRQTILMRHS